MTFCDDLWRGIADLNRKILEMPFNRELAAGTLSPERFKFYVIQDSLYLNSFSRALAIASAKAPDANAMLQFTQSAAGAITVERALHAGFLRQFGVEDAELAAAQKTPTCAGYTNFLLATAMTGSYEELVAAVLPCFWIYRHVGLEIAKVAQPGNPYAAWINTYSDESFGNAVNAVIGISNAAADAATPTTREAMRRAFNLCSVYEWMFWDSAYRQEQWPVPVP